MASRFWVGGTGSWDQVTTTHWSTTTGGVGGASVPTIADDVILDSLSGGGTITAIGTAGVITATGTIIPGASTFVISDTSASTKTFTGAGKIFNNLQINGAASAGAVQVTGSNTFNNITGQANAHLSLTSVTTSTISSLTSQGTAGNLFVLDAVTPGSAATLSSANRINTDFISVKDNTAAGITPFYAGTSGVLVSGTTNWLINSAPGTIPIYFTKAPTVMVIR